EARLLALGAPRDGEPSALGLRARLVLALLAQREPDPVEPARVDAGEHVGLVFARVRPAREQQALPAADDPRVVAPGEPPRARAAREREELAEAEAPVAARARVRCLAARVA